jgi:hypothetical protein
MTPLKSITQRGVSIPATSQIAKSHKRRAKRPLWYQLLMFAFRNSQKETKLCGLDEADIGAQGRANVV